MPPTLGAAQQHVRTLATTMLGVVEDSTLSKSAKSAALARLEPQLATAQATVATLKAQSRTNTMLMYGAGEAASPFDNETLGTPFGAGTIPAPSTMPSAQQLKDMHEAIVSRRSFKFGVKTATDTGSLVSPQLMPGVLGFAHEPDRILSHIPVTPMTGPSVEYMRHVSTTGSAATVAPGEAKPEISLVLDRVVLTASKIACHSAVLDENLADFSGFASYVSQELQRLLVDAENAQILNGDGTGTDLQGLLTATGILTRPKGADTGLDAIEQAINDLRVGAAYATADVIVCNPSDWSKLRRSKDGQQRYLVSPDPTQAEASSLWGIPVVQTTTMPAGTALVAAVALGALAYMRQGVTIETTPYSGTDWVENVTRFRCEERLALATPRPSALCKVTGL